MCDLEGGSHSVPDGEAHATETDYSQSGRKSCRWPPDNVGSGQVLVDWLTQWHSLLWVQHSLEKDFF